MKLWQKNTTVSVAVEKFTVGRDKEFDLLLAPFDVLGNMAHARMLASVGLLTNEEAAALVQELQAIYAKAIAGELTIADSVEDIHSQVEFLLTQALGDTGKKIHSARSRNDQVLVDIKLFLRAEITQLVAAVEPFFQLLQSQSEQFKNHLLPGYTHLQLAMPSSFGLWFGAYAESLVDDLITLQGAYKVVNKNPLGSAAGYGSSFPINRTMTTQLLGFADLNYNVVYAQMGRGKAERITAQAMANLAETLSRLSMDMCLYLNQQFSFVSFPAELTTGSSIMPHKKNPDVFELIRSHCNRIKALPNEISMMTTNLPSGYHRDLQLLKEHLFPAFQTLKDCLAMAQLMLENIQVQENIMANEKYKYAFSVEAVNELVLQGVPFRDAYKQVGLTIEAGNFEHGAAVNHVHEGSIGNLCNDQVNRMMQEVLNGFGFEQTENAIAALLQNK
ncbi:MAG TPA: argininosuccinate lyase [Sediminibacterium sp.]|nr:MAG: argininosuccinate lyase [Sphingobacteriia bacterium 35-40-8]OZA67624.1 MAG: argininosuccinate lyase [Sphingobacteriia bacterium 39-39-8]HQR92703.1 argininosuccinate lyase [Sediminibacterium sp.]HQS54968.1 argininosuccinate lyase [Sediminibacterium sp.]